MEEKPTECVAEKAGFDENNCFKEKGDAADEAVLKFDDGEELYVSEGFLSYASPVFKAMFTHECKPKEAREVDLTGKDFVDFHNFLLCLHPGVQKAVDRTNVLRISPLAREYKVMPTIAKCKEVMIDWIFSNTESNPGLEVRYSLVRSSLEILHKALECDFEEVIQTAEANLPKFAYEIFTGLVHLPPVTRYLKAGQFNTATTQSLGFGRTTSSARATTTASPFSFTANQAVLLHDKEDDAPAECKRLFDELPEKFKFNMLLIRLRLCDDGQFRGAPVRN